MSQNEGTFAADGSVELDARGAAEGLGNFNTLYAKGTWGGGTLQISASPTELEADAIDLTDIYLSADGMVSWQVKACSLWLTLSGSTSPDLDYWVV